MSSKGQDLHPALVKVLQNLFDNTDQGNPTKFEDDIDLNLRNSWDERKFHPNIFQRRVKSPNLSPIRHRAATLDRTEVLLPPMQWAMAPLRGTLLWRDIVDDLNKYCSCVLMGSRVFLHIAYYLIYYLYVYVYTTCNVSYWFRYFLARTCNFTRQLPHKSCNI